MNKKYRITKLGYVVFSLTALLVIVLAIQLPSLITGSQDRDGNKAVNGTESTTESGTPEATNDSSDNQSDSSVAGAETGAATTDTNNTNAAGTTTPEAQADLNKVMAESGVRIYFEPNKYDMSNQFYSEIDKFIDLALKHPETKILIEGNYNGYPGNKVSEFWTKLAQDRAEVVSAYMVAKGIPQERMKLINNGCSKMINKDDSLDELSKNRRVDLSFEVK